MTLPMTANIWRERQRVCKDWEGAPETFCFSADEAIRFSAQWLIERLYMPCSMRRHPWGAIVRRDKNMLRLTAPYDLSGEALNWGDLFVSSVELRDDGTWNVFIEEASPDCPQLSGYISMWLKRWGWPATVITEW